MTEAVVVHTDLPESHDAGHALGWQIAESMDGTPDVVIVFAAPTYNHTTLLHTLKQACHPSLLVGSSSAGEFTCRTQGEGMACAVALRSADMRFTIGVGRGLRTNHCQAAKELVSSFQGLHKNSYPFHSALILTDALAGHTDELIECLTSYTEGKYQFFGGGAGDNAQFRNTPVFYGTEVISDAVVALEILSKKPLGIGVCHGWQPNSQKMRITEAHERRAIRIDDMPAIEVFQRYAQQTGQHLDVSNPIPFFLHNLIGIHLGMGYKLRVPLSMNPDGSITCASDIPCGATIYLMRATTESATEAAVNATRTALQKLYGGKPSVAIFFDCVATRLRMGKDFGFELEGVQRILNSTCYAGCNTHGQIARVEGQFSGFHNCTAVICLIPE